LICRSIFVGRFSGLIQEGKGLTEAHVNLLK
jgi:hypothetical protein